MGIAVQLAIGVIEPGTPKANDAVNASSELSMRSDGSHKGAPVEVRATMDALAVGT